VKVIHSETEGNPFFVEEVFRHLSEEGRLLDQAGGFRTDLLIDELDVPEGVRLVIGRRLQRLGEDTRKALSAAAVIGRKFDYEVVRLMDGLGDDQLLDAFEEAERARLIVPAGSGSRYTFGHELIRQTLLTSLSLPRRQRLHLRAAEAIEVSNFVAGDDAAAELAHHLYQAGAAADAAKTVRALGLAGDVAMRSMAFVDALRHYENGLTIDLEDAGVRASALHGRGRALRSLGRWEDAIGSWREALSLLEGAGDPVAAGLMAWEVAHQLAWATKWVEATEVATRGLANLGDALVPERAYLTLMTGIVFSLAGNGEFGGRMIRDGLELAERIGDETAIGYSLYCQAIHHWVFWEPEACVEVGLRGIEALRRGGNLWDLAALQGFLGFAMLVLGRVDDAIVMADESMDLSRRLGHLGAQLIPGRVTAFGRLLMPGQIAEFESYLDEDIEICRTIGSPFIRDAYLWKGLVGYLRGEWDQALPWYERAAEEVVPGAWAPVHPMFLARHLALAGDPDRARRIVDEHARFLPGTGGEPVSFGSWCTLAVSVETLIALGDTAAAAELYPLTLRYAETGALAQAYDHRPVGFVAGLAAGAGDRWTEAVAHLERALEEAGRLGNRVADGEIRIQLARALLRRGEAGDRERAGEEAARAVAGCRELGMARHVEMARAVQKEAVG
ncbi:MAG: hypothetical protein LC722_00970, partial [Actinobacteria bacterium]|nr:hypothetical protein [Actinomycetota bacterium]